MAGQVVFFVDLPSVADDYLGMREFGLRFSETSTFCVFFNDPTNSIRLSPHERRVTIGSAAGEVTLSPSSLCVYFPLYFEDVQAHLVPTAVRSADAGFLRRQWAAFSFGLEELISSFMRSFNEPVHARRASNKLIQLSCLPPALWRLPRTFAGNSVALLDTDLFACLRVVKRVGDTPHVDQERTARTFLHDPKEPFDQNEVQASPFIVQEYIACAEEWRSFVFDQEVLTVRFPRKRVPRPDKVVDIHADPSAVEAATLIDPGDDHNQRAQATLRALKLDYAALDFVLSDDGPYLLEVNPVGTWYWLPEAVATRVQAAFHEAVYRHLCS